jgi:ABC-type hemin transport system substrate-binding protein
MTKAKSKIRFVLILSLLCLNTGPAQALRLVSLKPNITMTLLALGTASDVVGVTKYCPKPNKAATIVGDYMSINVEDIVRLKPDVILSSRENSQNRQYEPGLASESNTWIFQHGPILKKRSQKLARFSGAQTNL